MKLPSNADLPRHLRGVVEPHSPPCVECGHREDVEGLIDVAGGEHVRRLESGLYAVSYPPSWPYPPPRTSLWDVFRAMAEGEARRV